MAMFFAEILDWGSKTVDISSLLSMAITALATLFVGYVKHTAQLQMASLKSELEGKMDEMREKMEDKITDAFDGKFVSTDVYRSDKDAENQRFQMMMEMTNLKLDSVNKKIDELVQAVKEIK